MSTTVSPTAESAPGLWKPYPAYKDSGVEWLGDIPAHWELSPLRRVARVQLSNVDKHTVENEVPVRLCNYTDVYHRSFITPSIEFMEASALPREIAKFELRRGDVLITKDSESWMDIAVPGYVTTDLPGVLCGYHLAHIRPYAESMRGEYLFRAFQAEPIAYQFRAAATGVTRFALSGSDISSGLFPVPPLPEQQAIAAFLDRETAKIDALTEKKERLIALLQEKRAALISRAVTRGLDPDAPMKDSGVEWLGEIPAHWEVRRIKFLSSFITSGSRGWAQYYSSDGPVFLRVGNVARSSIDLNLEDIQHVAPPAGAEGERTRVCKDDVVVSITAYIGAVGVVPDGLGPAYVNQHLALVRPNHGYVSARWMAYCLMSQSGQTQFRLLLYGGTKDGLGLDDVANLKVVLPPIEEQQRLVSWIDGETARFGALIAKVRQHIEKLREYRTALISAAVTGKIDVRGEEAPPAVIEA